MLWLIWIALMLVAPMLAGVHVWLQLREEAETPTTPVQEA